MSRKQILKKQKSSTTSPKSEKTIKSPPRSLFARTESTARTVPVSTQKTPPPTKTTPRVEEPARQKSTNAVAVKTSAPKPTQVVEIESPSTTTQTGLNISALRNSFDNQAAHRTAWKENDYIQLIQRLDRLQTEAFILKGKLLSETKDKFYDSNRNGWIEFCESKLGMNYTTANQYIRVAQECDVMSHHHPELGFEHFKALLPALPEQRQEILKDFDGGSVKKLRHLVASVISATETGTSQSTESTNATRAARMLLKQLQSLHSSISGVTFNDLPPQLGWQVSVACSQVAASLMRASQLASGLGENDDIRPTVSLKRAAAQVENPKIIKVDLEA